MELQLYCTYVLMQYMCKGISSGDFVVRVGEYLSTQTTTIGRIHSSISPTLANAVTMAVGSCG